MSMMTTPGAPFLRTSEFALACALVDARQEAARTGRVRYVHAAAATGWGDAAAAPRGRRPYYRVYPGGHVEHHPAPPPHRRAR